MRRRGLVSQMYGRLGWRTMSRRWLRAIRGGSRGGRRTRSWDGRLDGPDYGDCSGVDLALQVLRHALEILDERTHLEFAGLVVGRPQDR